MAAIDKQMLKRFIYWHGLASMEISQPFTKHIEIIKAIIANGGDEKLLRMAVVLFITDYKAILKKLGSYAAMLDAFAGSHLWLPTPEEIKLLGV